mmetsp:Transcript_134247/g.233288  ORF Transcript_134247/g.233288 Transcript_134247/m.233288 type:complete len:360 (+) Transcript_134247:112-1191(+)
MTTDNRFVQFNKTKMCKFDAIGRCKKGRECPFAHAVTELRPVPDLRCTKLCKALVLNGTCADPTCGYAHSKEELRSTGTFHKTKLCRFMQTGHCALGKKCNFAHNMTELREMDKSALEAETPEDVMLLPTGGENEMPDLTLQEGMMLPPGLGWENIYDGLAEAGATNQDIPDFSAIVHNIPDYSPFGHVLDSDSIWQPSKVGKAETSTLARDSPAYIPLPSMESHFPSTTICQAVEGSDQIGHLKFDSFVGDILSLSTRSQTSTPPSTDLSSPSPTGSGSTSGKASDQAMGSSLYQEGSLEALSQAAGRLGAFGLWDTDPFSANMPSFEDGHNYAGASNLHAHMGWEETPYALPQNFAC